MKNKDKCERLKLLRRSLIPSSSIYLIIVSIFLVFQYLTPYYVNLSKTTFQDSLNLAQLPLLSN